VADPYRWLEEPDSAESRAWLAAQDELAAEYLTALPGRSALAARIADLAATGLVSSPVWRGERCFFLRREPGQEHAVLITSAPGEPDRTLLDPMALDPSGATTLDAWAPDNDGRLLAYQISYGGDEESVLLAMDVVTGANVDGPIDRCRYTQVAWLPGGESYYYVRRLAPEAVPADEAQYHHRVYLHTVGTPAEADGGPELLLDQRSPHQHPVHWMRPSDVDDRVNGLRMAAMIGVISGTTTLTFTTIRLPAVTLAG